MFSLIITIIAIALVAALALATIYYGGSSFNKGAASANASKLLTQAQQLLAADKLYRVDHEGQKPTSIQVLIDEGYLKSAPTASLTTKFAAIAANTGSSWQLVLTSTGTAYSLSNTALLDQESCKALNQKSLGQNGILKEIYNGYQTQCYGPALDNLSVILLTDLATSSDSPVLPNSPVVNNGSVISESSWLTAPDSTNAGGGSTGGGSTGGGNTPPDGLQMPAGFTYTGDDLPANLTADMNEVLIAFKNGDSTPFNISGVSGNLAGGNFTISEGPYCGLDTDDNRYYCSAFVVLSNPTLTNSSTVSGSISVTTTVGASTIPVTYTPPTIPVSQQLKFVSDYLAGAQLRITGAGSENEFGQCSASAQYVPGSNLIMGDNHSGCITEASGEVTDQIYFETQSAINFELLSTTITSLAGTTTTTAISPNCMGQSLPSNPNAIQNEWGYFDGPYTGYAGCSINLTGILGGSVTVTYTYRVNGGPVQSVTKTRNIVVNNAVY